MYLVTSSTPGFEVNPPGEDVVTSWLEEVLLLAARLTASGDEATDATRIDRIALLERLKAAVTAAQAAEMVRFADSQVDAQRTVGWRRRWLGRGVADQIALACRVSPSEGSRRLITARALVHDLPATMAALASGELNAYTSRLIVEETSHLDARTRRAVDADLHRHDLSGFSPREVGAHARRLAIGADPEAAHTRAKRARNQRRVTLRRAADTMSLLTGVLPAEQGAACWRALGRHADRNIAAGDQRSRGQILADTLVERLTGQATAPEVPVEVQITVPVETLAVPTGAKPADLTGYGPLPADLIRDLLSAGTARRWWRRIFTAPAGGARRTVVSGDPRRRRFPRGLASLIVARDRSCRDPYCGAPIRHVDHVLRYADGGQTTFGNGRGVCVRGNLVRELPGWQVHLVRHEPHTTVTITPTGHHYLSRAAQPP